MVVHLWPLLLCETQCHLVKTLPLPSPHEFWASWQMYTVSKQRREVKTAGYGCTYRIKGFHQCVTSIRTMNTYTHTCCRSNILFFLLLIPLLSHYLCSIHYLGSHNPPKITLSSIYISLSLHFPTYSSFPQSVFSSHTVFSLCPPHLPTSTMSQLILLIETNHSDISGL